MGKVYDEQLISSAITSLKSAEEILDSSCQSLESIVNSDGYYSDLKTGVTNLKELLTVHGEFSKFLSNAKALYDVVCCDIEQSVDDIATSNIDIIYDTLLLDYGMVDQKDPRWKDLRYGSSTVGGGGCGPSSVANALIITFGIRDPNKVRSLLQECVALGGAGSTVSDYLVGKSRRNSRYPTLNSIIDNAGGPIYYVGGSGNKVLEYIRNHPPKDGQKVYLLGKMSFQSGGRNDSGYTNVVNIVDALYKTAPNTNITFFGMAGGTGGRAFGSKSDSGHYVSLLINVKDFKENGSVYLLDSYPRRLPGESNNGEFWGDYNFTAKPNYGDFKKVNSAFKFTRISRDIIKIQVKGGGTFTTEHLRLLGLSGGTHLVTSPGNSGTTTVKASTNKGTVDYSAKFDETLQGQLPKYGATTDTTEENNRARTMAAASREARQAANNPQTNPVTTEPLIQPSRLTGDLSNVPTEETDNVVPEEYEFPKETEPKLKASNDEPATPNKGNEEQKEESKPEEKKEEIKEEKKTVTAKEETTTVTGVIPTVTATSSAPAAPTTASSQTQVTVTGDTNPNGYSMPTDNKTPTTPSNPSVPSTPATNTPKMTASTGVSDIRFNSGETTTPTTPTTTEGSMTANAQPTIDVDANAVNNVVVNETITTEEGKENKSDKSNKRKTTTAIAGASLLVAGTTALLLNSNPNNYKVELIGDPEVSIIMNQNYSDPGCKVLEDDKELELKANIKINLDITTPGTYKMTCSVNNDSKTRYINVNQDNDNDTVGNVNIFYNDSNVLPTKYDDTEVTVDTTYTIRYNDNVDYIKYCVAEYGEKCTVGEEEKHNNDTFKINETGKRVIYIEKYSNGSMVKEVRYINIK